MRYSTYIKEISNTVAYWISPRGEVVDVSTNHIDVVIKNPSKFGLTLRKIQDIYERHGEQLGKEGNAREEIILDLVKQGWIRVRRYRNQGYSINIGKMSKKVKDILYDWASKLLNTGIKGMKENDKYMPVTIIGFLDHTSKSLTIQDIANDVLYEGQETFDVKNSVVIMESAGELYEPKRVLDDIR